MEAGQLDWTQAFAAVRRSWAFVLLCTLAVAGVAVGASLQVPPTERVTSRLIVSPDTGPDADFNVADTVRVLTQPGVMGTLSEILQNPRGLEQAADAAGIPAAQLVGYEVVAQEVPESLVLEIHVEGPESAVAAELSTGLLADATALFDELYPVYEVRVLDPPRPFGEPILPSPVQFGVLGGIVGAFGASLLAIGWSRLRGPRERRATRSRRNRRGPRTGTGGTPTPPDADPTSWPRVPPPATPPTEREAPVPSSDRP